MPKAPKAMKGRKSLAESSNQSGKKGGTADDGRQEGEWARKVKDIETALSEGTADELLSELETAVKNAKEVAKAVSRKTNAHSTPEDVIESHEKMENASKGAHSVIATINETIFANKDLRSFSAATTEIRTHLKKVRAKMSGLERELRNIKGPSASDVKSAKDQLATKKKPEGVRQKQRSEDAFVVPQKKSQKRLSEDACVAPLKNSQTDCSQANAGEEKLNRFKRVKHNSVDQLEISLKDRMENMKPEDSKFDEAENLHDNVTGGDRLFPDDKSPPRTPVSRRGGPDSPLFSRSFPSEPGSHELTEDDGRKDHLKTPFDQIYKKRFSSPHPGVPALNASDYHEAHAHALTYRRRFERVNEESRLSKIKTDFLVMELEKCDQEMNNLRTQLGDRNADDIKLMYKQTKLLRQAREKDFFRKRNEENLSMLGAGFSSIDT
eukprot:GEMP01027100.1.p1 GENE.GEMP01027100.1~~GEMP01027100.1.p1  ORF type:complete len:438 (+),score=91.72 GEMP01027100.1:37-1350(+)